MTLNIVEDGVLLDMSSYTEDEKAAQLVLHAQLNLTRNMIEQLEGHPHFSDDCGEYLWAALSLGAELMDARQNGPDALHEALVMMSEVQGEWEYASDAMTEEYIQWMKNHKAEGVEEF